MNYITLFFTLLLPLNSIGVILSEEVIFQEARKNNSPSMLNLDLELEQAKLQASQTQEQFSAYFMAGANYIKTKERALISFSPVFSPVKQGYARYQKKFLKGFSLETGINLDKRSTLTQSGPTALRDASTVSPFIGVEIDLWKDFLGRVSGVDLINSQKQIEKSKLERKMNQTRFLITLRRVYWSLVANDLSMNISESLGKTNKRQLKMMRKRQKSGVADSGDVALFNSQVISNEADIEELRSGNLSLEHQLRTLLPGFKNEKLKLGAYNPNKALLEILNCTAKVIKHEETPYEYTYQDEILDLISKMNKNIMKKTNAYSDIDVKFKGRVSLKGIDTNTTGGSFSGAIDDFRDQGRESLEFGLEVKVPIGSQTRKSESILKRMNRLKVDAIVLSMKNQLELTHQSFVRNIGTLENLVTLSEKNTQTLKKRLKVMERKFSQARISEADLINDQKSFLASNLGTIGLKLKILNTVFDYFEVFPDFPCGFNITKRSGQ